MRTCLSASCRVRFELIMIVVGIDLAGSEKRKTGFCSLNEKLIAKVKVLYKDQEIIKETIKVNPDLVSIDAPLSLPKGRKNLEDKGGPHFRECDKELIKMRIKFFPITLGPMRKLTIRGIRLKGIFENRGIKVIETFPGAAQDILGMPRKQKNLEKLRNDLKNYGIKNINEKLMGDELDAITCALVGKMYLENKYLAIGDPKEGLIILPKN